MLFTFCHCVAHDCSGRQFIDAALRGEMDILLVLNASRLGRDIRNTLEYVDWLEKHNVEVVCLNGDFSIRGVGQFLLAKQTAKGSGT